MSNNHNISSPDNNDNEAAKVSLLNELHQHEAKTNNPKEIANEFDMEAAQGLKQLNNQQITGIVAQLNNNLKLQLKKKKKYKRNIPSQTTVIITIVTILIFIVLAYVIIKKLAV